MFLIWFVLRIFIVFFFIRNFMFCVFKFLCRREVVFVFSCCFIKFGIKWIICMFIFKLIRFFVVFKLSNLLLMIIVFFFLLVVLIINCVFLIVWNFVILGRVEFFIGKIKVLEFVVIMSLLYVRVWFFFVIIIFFFWLIFWIFLFVYKVILFFLY